MTFPGFAVQRGAAAFGRTCAVVWRCVIVLLAPVLVAFGPCILMVMAMALLLYSSQGSELGRSAEEFGWIGLAGLLLACLTWSLMSWYWCRQLLDRAFKRREHWSPARPGCWRSPMLSGSLARIGLEEGAQMPPGQEYAMRAVLAIGVTWLPRLLALLPFAIAAVMLGDKLRQPVVLWLLAGLAAIVLVLLLARRRIIHLLSWENFRPRLALPGLVFSTAVIGLFLIFPIQIGQGLGAVGVVFLFFAALLPIIAHLSILSARWCVPIILLVFVFLAALPVLHPGRHAVRSLAQPPPDRLGMHQAVASWLGNQRDAAKNPPLVVVTTAGGGISAAVWTGLLLAAVQDQDPRFAGRIFAISAVSGGALGAATFVASIPPLRVSTAVGREPCFRFVLEHLPACVSFGTVYAALSTDFLGPTVAAYLFGDTFGPPLAPLLGPRIQDRATILERGWEAACQAAGCPALSGSFHDLRTRAEWRPSLFLNGTHVESGKRVVTSPVMLSMSDFDDALDFFALHGRDIRVSTAVLNSARFPYVTPAGRIIASDGSARGHVADGGYFENYGAETGAEIMRSALGFLRTFQNGVRPVVIEISSDPALSRRDLSRGGSIEMPLDCHSPASGNVVTLGPNAPLPIDCHELDTRWVPQLWAPAGALLATRSARGVQTSRRVWRQAVTAGGTGVQFALCAQQSDRERPPLGWSLSQATMQAIAADVADIFSPSETDDVCRNANRHALRRLRWALSTEPVPPL